MMEKSLREMRPACQRCFMGLITIHYPIKIKKNLIGNLQTVCAIKSTEYKQKLSELYAITQKLNLPEEEVKEAISNLQRITKKKEQFIHLWFDTIANLLSDISSDKVSPSTQQKNLIKKEEEMETLEQHIRDEINRHIPIPAWRANRCMGVNPTLINEIEGYLSKNYSKPLSLKVVSQALGFEPAFFAKEFKRIKQSSFPDLLRKYRIEEAQQMLRKDPYVSVKEAAYKVGYKNTSYFIRVFNETVGMSPRTFQKKFSH